MNELRNPPIKRSEEETLQALSEEKLVVLNSLQTDLTNNKNQIGQILLLSVNRLKLQLLSMEKVKEKELEPMLS